MLLHMQIEEDHTVWVVSPAPKTVSDIKCKNYKKVIDYKAEVFGATEKVGPKYGRKLMTGYLSSRDFNVGKAR